MIGNVTVPRMPRKGLPLLPWALETNRAIQQLRDRMVPGGDGGRGGVGAAKTLVLRRGTAANKIKVTPGYVNDVMPTLSGTALNATTPPELTIAANTTVFLCCQHTFSGTVSTITVDASTSGSPTNAEAISATGYTTNLKVGTVTWSSPTATIATNRSGGDLATESFGSANLWWTT